MARREVADRRLIDLHVAAGQHAPADLLRKRSQPERRQSHPLRQGLAREPDAVPGLVHGLLPVERQMIDVFAHQHVRQQPWGDQAALLQAGRQRGHDRHAVHLRAAHYLCRMVRRRRKRAGS